MGNSTKESIVSGVQNGVLSEVNLIISKLKKENKDLIVIVTGGDTFFFENALKNSIFADENFVLKGLNEILSSKLLLSVNSLKFMYLLNYLWV